MADIITYKPTEGLTPAQRTQDGYYAAIKTWVQSLSQAFEKWFDITYTDESYTILFTPKDANIAYFYANIAVEANSVKINYRYGSSTTSESHSGFTNDVAFYIYDGLCGFFIGMDTRKIIYAIMSGLSFGTLAKKQVMLCNYGGSTAHFCVSGTTTAFTVSSDYNKVAGGITDVYRIQPMPISGTDIVLDSVYYFDGGMSNPPSGVFKVGSDKYCTIAKNVAIKLK